MLMRALISRLNFGTDANSTTMPSSHRRSVDFVYQQFPTLPRIVLRLLVGERPMSHKTGMPGQQRVETVFPALEILERYGMPTLYGERVESIVESYMGGPLWLLRDKAAKAFSSNVGEDRSILTLRILLNSELRSQNARHGRLLAARWLIRLQRTYLCEGKHGKGVLVRVMQWHC